MDRYSARDLDRFHNLVQNQRGGFYRNGAVLDDQKRARILTYINEVVSSGLVSRGVWRRIAEKCEVSDQTVVNLRNQFLACFEIFAGDDDEKKVQAELGLLVGLPRGNPEALCALSWEDVDFIKTRLEQDPTLYLYELTDCLRNDLGVEVAVSTLCKTLNGLGITRKQITKIHDRRYSPENIIRRARYIEFVHSVDPARLYFFDESGFSKADGFRKYGRGLKRRVEAEQPYGRSANVSLLAVMGLSGFVAFHFHHGPVTSDVVWAFFVSQVLPLLPRGSIVVMDNAKIHHGETAVALKTIFDLYGCHIVFLPGYSPDLNPIENSFGATKCLVKRNRELYQLDMEGAIVSAASSIRPASFANWYRNCGLCL